MVNSGDENKSSIVEPKDALDISEEEKNLHHIVPERHSRPVRFDRLRHSSNIVGFGPMHLNEFLPWQRKSITCGALALRQVRRMIALEYGDQ